ncbi:CRISPR-associated helicase/endonuclease Cas3 [Romboutsia timonensis]|uniref:CRISPR-associated helicase/endonuclease Cas3 n=1 Tax=Romboutsia timonensis TaxID=1776391 RepID=UPI0008DA4A36|nr:CRISPR-associated helicase/endonuclease Cas3 [Romboutsia timonensis]
MVKDIYFDLLDESIVSNIREKKAKPNKSIIEHTNDLLDVLEILWNLGYIKEERIYELIQKACIYHDIGKINKEFQKRVKNKGIKFDENKEVAHNVLSLYFIDESKFNNKEDYLIVSNAVVNHHDYCDIGLAIREKSDIIENLLEGLDHKKVKKVIPAKIASISQDIDAIKIKGYLHKCDYSASSGYTAEYENNFLEKSLENVLNKWKLDNQDASWNELQQYCIENKNENIIAIAQTGMGKTEAGLLWISDNKGFFILPIRTAINAIYDRTKKYISSYGGNLEEQLGLLHSSSLEYLLLQSEDDKYDDKDEYIDKKEDKEIIEYEKIAKQLSLPINVSTIDQLFDFVYKYPAYELKLTTLSYSKIVIDEIQMYGPDLLAYLVYGLERIVEQGGKVAILTATLPPFVKELLSKSIKFKIKEDGFTDNSKRHNLKILDKRIDSNDICNKYRENEKLNKSNKILVVCNSITQAQNLYEEISNILGNENLHILHSKFIKCERLSKESEIIEFGKTYKDNKIHELDKQSGIWISTSIVEASLDIDFDYLFTELQDLNSLFQRLGRCNRKGKKDSSENNCYIYTQIDERSFINGDRGYIDKDIFELSKEAISLWEGQISEKEKIELINKYLTMDKIKNSNYITQYKHTYNFIKNLTPDTFKSDEVKLRNILSKDIIPSPIYHEYNGDIKELELKLKDKSLNSPENKGEKIKLQNKLKKYTVSVHPNHITNYYRALKNGLATRYDNVRVSDYEYIPVIECEYTELGYRQKKFVNQDNINTNISNIDDFIF